MKCRNNEKWANNVEDFLLNTLKKEKNSNLIRINVFEGLFESFLQMNERNGRSDAAYCGI